MRPTNDVVMLEIALIVATRSTCLRRQVGCVLVDKYGHILSTGFNGVARGLPHCNESSAISHVSLEVENVYPHACQGAFSQSGLNLESCNAIHAEQNALLQCKDVHAIRTAYITTSPCVTCTKLLLNTECGRILYKDDYPAPCAKDLWTSAGRVWDKSSNF